MKTKLRRTTACQPKREMCELAYYRALWLRDIIPNFECGITVGNAILFERVNADC